MYVFVVLLETCAFSGASIISIFASELQVKCFASSGLTNRFQLQVVRSISLQHLYRDLNKSIFSDWLLFSYILHIRARLHTDQVLKLNVEREIHNGQVQTWHCINDSDVA